MGTREVARDASSSLWAGVLVGVALMAAVDEIVFHQILHWHHFFDRATSGIALVSDGILHAGELVALVAGGAWMLRLHGTGALAREHATAGAFLGAGGFQLLDGIVLHKVLQLHQIRYGVVILPYDLAWNVFALALIGIGATLLMRARRGAPRDRHARDRAGGELVARGT